jgi:heme/copper-type cytochrome/quinol oxidase subunit 2
MQVNYQLSENDFVEAYGVHRNRTAFKKWSMRIFIALIVFMAVVVFATALFDHTQQAAKNLLPFTGLLAFWIVALWAFPRWNMRRQFHKQPAAHGPRTVTFDADGAHWRWDGGSGDIAWKNYIRWIEGTNQILFYTSPACFNILPTHGLPSQQMIDLRELLKQNIQTVK